MQMQRLAGPALAFFVLGGLASPAAHADNFDQAVLADNPLAYFNLDSINEPSAVNGYTTTFNGGATVTAPGGGAPIASNPSNAGAAFNGTQDPSGYGSGPSISTSFGPTTSLTAGTLLGWFDLAATPGTGGASGIEYVAGESQVGNDFDVQVQNDDHLYFYTNGGGNVNTPITTNQYYFFAATFDQSANAVDLYVNGALVASGTNAGSAKISPFTIGDSDVFHPRNFDGTIDDVAVYDTALTASQISTIYTAAGTPAVTSVPESSSWSLLAVGLPLVGFIAHRRRA